MCCFSLYYSKEPKSILSHLLLRPFGKVKGDLLMAEEVGKEVSAKLTEKGVVVEDPDAVAELAAKGFGVKEGDTLLLKDFEALYLMYIKRLAVYDGDRCLTFNEMVDYALRRDPDAWTRFIVYRDLRSRGYVVKDGFGFGVDFRVYDRGEHSSKPARYLVFSLNEGSKKGIRSFSKAVDKILEMGKEPVIAVIERRGEVIYYKVSKMRFKKP
jgi:tRNA-intron endonuclease